MTGPDRYLGAQLGSYRVHALIGKGGMGYVYRAEHVKLGREVALKLLRTDYATRRDAVSRFFQEARTVSRVRHRNIVEVTDFVELGDGTTYIVMELLDGASLGAWVRSGVELRRVLAVLIQICDGLGAAHQVGVVHRDLKPDNVIIVATAEGAEHAKLLDFGVAKLLHGGRHALGFQTAAGSVIGTPAYMSPEQAGGMEVDPRSDLYSLGAIMYELFAGQPVFRARSFGEYVRMHLTQLPVPPRQTPGGAAMPAELEAVILRCLDKDPAQRFAHTGALRDALLAVLKRVTAEAQPLAPGPGDAPSAPRLAAPATGAAHEAALPRAGRWASRASPRWLVGIALTLGLGGLAASWLPTRGAAADSPPRAAAGSPPRAAPGSPPRAAAGSPPRAAAGSPPRAAHPANLHSGPQATEPGRAHPLVQVDLDSAPRGDVFVEHGTAALCRTPCTFHVDLTDGGPADQRRFVVKRTGYMDGLVTVDLTAKTAEHVVRLRPTVPARRTRSSRRPDTASRRTVGRTELPTPPRDASAHERPPGAHELPPDVHELPPDVHDHDRATRDDHDRAMRADPELDVPDATRPPPPARTEHAAVVPAIDPADTLDPFRFTP